MKHTTLTLLIVFFVLTGLVSPKLNFNNFIKDTLKNFNPPESVARTCDWQYVLIKLHTNALNQVTDYEVLNQISEDFKNSLTYLKGYQFDKNMPINRRPIIFCMSIINLREENCDVVGPNHRKLLSGVDKLKEYKVKNLLKEKNSIFICQEIRKQVFDPVN